MNNISFKSSLGSSMKSMLLWLLMLSLTITANAQVVNKRLYLKSGNGLSRVMPTSTTISSTAPLIKQTATMVLNGSFATSNSGSNTGSLASTAFTPSGTNRLLLISIGSVVGANNAVSSATFGGVAMTKLTETQSAGFKVEYWFLKSPATTSGTIQINWPTGNILECAVGYTVMNNVDLINTFGVPANAAGTGASALSVPSAAGDIVVDAIATNSNNFTVGTGQTQLFAAGTNSVKVRSSWINAATGNATSTTMNWTGMNSAWVHQGVAIKGNSNDASFTQNPAMCSPFVISGGQPITIVAHAAVAANTVSVATVPVSAELTVGGTVIFSSLNAANSGLGATGTTGTLTWTGTIPSNIIVAAGQPVVLTLSNDYSAADIRIDFDATNKVSYVQLPTTTYINVNSLNVRNAPAGGGAVVTQQAIGVANYIRAVVSDPFGFDDITGLNISINGGAPLAATSVATAGCTRTYEYMWTPTTSGAFTIQATAREGTEGTVTHSATTNFTVVRPSVSVVKTKTAPAGASTVGSNITYNIAITNTGQSPISLLPLQDIFSSSALQYVSATPAPSSVSAGLVTWNNLASSSLAAGATTNVSVTFTILSNNNPLNNTARVEGARDNLNYLAPTASNTVSVTVANVPDAVIDRFYISGAIALNLLANDTDADVAGFLSAHTGSYNVTIDAAPGMGSATVNGDRTIQFNPTGMSEDALSTFRYRVTEIATGLWDTATVFVRFSGVNNPPAALSDVASTLVNEAVRINVLGNDSDIDGVLQTPTITAAPANGTVVVNADRTITYTPFNGFTGTDVFTYRICDDGFPLPAQCTNATVTVAVVNAIVVCQQSSHTFTVAAVPGATSYTWTVPAGATVSSAYTGTLPNPITTGTSITINFNGVAPGAQTLCARPTNECGDGTSQCTDVFVNRMDLATAVTNVLCRSSNTGAIALTVTGGRAPITYSWTGPSGYTSTAQNPTGLLAGTYTVTATDRYGCTATATATITQPATSLSVNGTVTNENPFGSMNGAIDITPAGGTAPYSYSWSNGSVSEDISNLAGGTYTVTVRDANGCTVSRIFTVQAIGAPLSISSLTKVDIRCTGAATGSIELEVIGGSGTYTYTWSGPSGYTAATQDITNLAAGTYTVVVNDGSNTVTNSITINQPAAALSASTTPTNVSCNGGANGSITLTPAGGTAPYSYLWSNGATTKDLTGLAAGNYSVIVTDANGCTTTATQTITQPTSPVTGTAVITNSNCAAGNTGAIVLTPSGGTAPYTYLWSNGATTKDLSGLAPGYYSVVITDALGCSSGRSFNVGNACIGVAKAIASTPINNGNGSYTLTYSIKVENKGTVALNNVQVTENLANTFVGATSFAVSSITSGSFTVNSGFNGTGNNNLLAAPLGTLAVGESKFVALTVTVVPGTKLGVYDNTAIANAQDANGVAVSDASQNGTDTDPDNDGNPTNNNIPTPLTFIENPLIGVAKSVTAGPVNNLDGSYNVTYTITLKNFGDVQLRNVQVSDNFATTFGGAPVSVVSVTSGQLSVNNTFNGIGNNNLLAGTDILAVNEIKTVVVTVRVWPASLATYNNIAVASAQGPGNTVTTDNSTNGTNPDPDNDDNPNNNSIPTPVTFTEAPVIGLAKRVVGTPINNGDGSYSVQYQLLVKNVGNVPLKNIQVVDNLATTFGGRPVTVDSVRTSSAFVANNIYNGTSNLNLLAGNDSLAIGATATINIYLKVTPGNNLGVYNNTATANATGPLGTPTTDISNNGTDVDTENDGPGNNSIPTPLTFTEAPQIGVAKRVTTPVNNGNGTYSLSYIIRVENTGDGPVNTIQVQDDLVSTFTGATAFVVNGVTTTGTLTANNAFNGNSNRNLLTAPSTLARGASAEITINLTVTPGNKLGVYDNIAFATALSAGGNPVSDSSTNGSLVDPDGDGNPRNNQEPTPVQFSEAPKLGVAKRVLGAVTNNGNGTYTFTYEIKVQNMGDVPLHNVQVADALAEVFPAPATVAVNSLVVHQQPASSTFVTNGSYNGITNSFLLTGTSSLAVGQVGILRLTLTVNPAGLGGPFYNSANAFGVSPGGRFAVDNSQDGPEVDPDNDNDPTNNNDPTPITFFENPKIGLSKRLVSVVQTTPGVNRVTFELKVRNFGDVELRNIRITDDIVTQFAGVFPTSFSATEGTLFANSAWNGTASSNILADEQRLAVGDSGTVFVSFIVVPRTTTRRDNLASASGVTIMGVQVTDVSTDGLNPDADLDGDPNNDDVPTPVNFILYTWDRDGDGVPDEIDIDDDNDGITDFVEVCGPGATTFSCTPNGSDPSGDDDDDGIPNWQDADWCTLNAAGACSFLDADGDGIPDYLDRDSDNDGIPDVIEAGGVDADGDGIIDNYCDTDGDGLSQNVDANNTGAAGSGVGLGSPDFDGDGVPNYKDLDSDNDGIPDIVESYGADTNNDGRVDNFTDADGDGWTDRYDGDADGDGVVENLSGVLVLSMPDAGYVNCANPGNGRATCYALRGNLDGHGLPNFLDLDSDGDGLTDAVESGITAVTYTRSMVTGSLTNGWSNDLSALSELSLRNTDGIGRPDIYDIDSDNDGITDNIEAQPTGSYVVPTDADTDGDGLVDVYDIFNGIGGNGITPYDHDADGTPDYRDLDTDNDGAPDRNEGDKRFETLTQAAINTSGDTDGDGLMDIFDIFSHSTPCGTPLMNVVMNNMGPNGNYHGPTPGGSRVQLVQSFAAASNRDWRNSTVLPLQVVQFTGSLHNTTATLKWNVLQESSVTWYQVERSVDGVVFNMVGKVNALNQSVASYTYADDVSSVNGEYVFYRITQVNTDGNKYSTHIIRLKLQKAAASMSIYPNPIASVATLSVTSEVKDAATLMITDVLGKAIVTRRINIEKGNNNITLYDFGSMAGGTYFVKLIIQQKVFVEKVSKQ
ncbi:Ig-like domain-containing protein [Aridibaculum aurantiacum]|uniref:Ig-like domain-containing protein n=1 Tax=Aridibaculum aurantiacum TaxID=2810307 RepID=UPI001A95E4D6|nr:Ig-like domain-containing protein [Aridibaculum aurantiacum]